MPAFIPIEAGGKRPLVRGWASPGYTSPSEVPDGANLALRTDGIIVVDCDTAEAADAWLSRAPGTPVVVRTPRGTHFYYRLPDGVSFRPGPLAPKVDIKTGPGAFVLVPPSTIGESRYLWAGAGAWNFDPARLPDAPVELIRELLNEQQRPGDSDGEGWDTVPEGRRNITLTALAGSLRKQGAGAEAIAATLATVNANRCQPPLPHDEVVAIVRSVLRYEPEPYEPGGDIEVLIDGESSSAEEDRPLVVWAHRLEVPPPPKWLRFPYLPAGRLVLVDGNEGIGKGMFATWVAVTAAAGGFDGGPAPVLWGSTEDDPAEDILRRLLAAGYDADTHEPIGFLSGEALAWRYPQDIGRLAQVVRDNGVKVLILDPGRSFLGPPEGMGMSEFSYNNEALVRPGLEALNLLARKLDVMVLFIHHWNKNLTASIRVRSSGSAAFAQTVRHRVTLNYLNGEHALAVEKSNLTSREHTVTAYCLTEVEEWDTARFTWGDPEMAVDLDEWEQQHRGEAKLTETEEATLNASLVAAQAESELTPGDPFWTRDELRERFGIPQRLARSIIEELRQSGAVGAGPRNRLVWQGE